MEKENKSLDKKIIDELSIQLWTKLSSMKIKDVCKNSYHPFSGEQYEEYSVTDFLNLVKLPKLLCYNKINTEEYNKLLKVIELKNKISKRLGFAMMNQFKDNNEETSKKVEYLQSQYNKLNSILRRYRLLGDNYQKEIFDIDKILNFICMKEDNPTYHTEFLHYPLFTQKLEFHKINRVKKPNSIDENHQKKYFRILQKKEESNN